MNSVRRVCLAVGVWSVVLAGCAAPVPQEPAIGTGRSPQVWPEPPEQARIRFEREFSQPADLGIQKSLFGRLAEFVFGEEPARLVRPMAIVRSGENLFVADPGARGIHRFNPRAGSYSLIRGQDGEPLLSPVGLAAGLDGEVFVTDSALGQVLRIAPGSNNAIEVPVSQTLEQPTGIAFDPVRHELVVVDTTEHRLNVYSRDGQLKRTLGGRGSDPGEFNFPTLLWRSQAGQLHVTDALNFRVQILDADGHPLLAFGQHGDGTGNMARHKGVATDAQGHIYVVDSLFNAVQIFDAEGRFLLSIGGLGHGPGQFWLPTGIFIDDNDDIFVADAYNGRVQVFRYVGGGT